MPLTKVRHSLEEVSAFRWRNVGKLFVWIVALILLYSLIDLLGMWIAIWTTPPQETTLGV